MQAAVASRKDANRRGNYPNEKLDLPGYTSGPRRAKSQLGKYFVSFGPPVSDEAVKEMRREMRAKLYPSKDPSLPTHIEMRLLKWVLRMRERREIVEFVSSSLDLQRYPAEEIIALYARQWRIDTLF